MSARRGQCALLLGCIATVSACAPSTNDWCGSLSSTNPFQRVMGAAALGEVEPREAPQAVMALIQAFDREQPDFRRQLAASLARVAPHALPTLCQAIPNSILGQDMREDGLRDALQVGRDRLLPELVASLGQPERVEDDAAMTLLPWFRPKPVQELVNLLGDEARPPSARTRARALILLGTMEGAARAAVPAIFDLLVDDDPVVRGEAEKALDRIDPDSPIRRWTALLRSPKPAHVEFARKQLCRDLGNALPILVTDLGEKDLGQALRALRAMSELADCDDALLRSRTLSPPKGGKKETDDARAIDLWRMCLADPVDEDAIATLQRALGEDATSVRCCAALALGHLGVRAASADAALAALRANGPPVVREAARLGLRQIRAR